MPNTKISRSARTGKIVTAKKAKRNPRTTVTETVTPYQRNRSKVLSLLQHIADGTFPGVPYKTAAKELLQKITKGKKVKTLIH